MRGVLGARTMSAAGRCVRHRAQVLWLTSQLRACPLAERDSNATALHNSLIGLARQEFTHQDRPCILALAAVAFFG